MNLKNLKQFIAVILAVMMLVSVAMPAVSASGLMTDEDELDRMFYSQKQINFFNTICPLAVQDMVDNGILASLTIAQAIWESGWGVSNLALKTNNLFGIKATVYWEGKAYSTGSGQIYDTYAEAAAQGGKIFRAYDSWQDSVNDHSDLFNSADRYANLRGLRDYKLACTYLIDDGYTSSYEYAENLIWSIEYYELTQYDDQAIEILNSKQNDSGDSLVSKAPSSITISNTSLSMGIGTTHQLSTVITPEDADTTVKWTSSDPSVVSVKYGMLTALKAGKAEIIAETVNGLGIECTVTVSEEFGKCVIDKETLLGCASTDAVVAVPYGIKEIKDGALSKLSDTKEIIIPSTVTKIADKAFGTLSSFTLAGFAGSAAEKFASSKSLSFKKLRSEAYTLDSKNKTVVGVPAGYNAVEAAAYFAEAGKTASVFTSGGTLMAATLDATVSTGCKIKLDGTEYTLAVSGDIDGDGALTVTDYILLKRALLNTYDFTSVSFAAADIENDGSITTTDLIKLQKHLQNLYVING